MTSAKYDFLDAGQRARIRSAIHEANRVAFRPHDGGARHIDRVIQRLARFYGVSRDTIVRVWHDRPTRRPRWY